MSSLLVFNRVYRLEIQSVMLVFLTPLVKNCPSNLLTGSPPPLPPSLCEEVQVYVFVTGGGRREGIGMCGEHIQELYTVFEQIPNLQNCFTTPNKKPRRGGGLRQINACRKVPSPVNF
jgi:hypothetical protein